MTVSIMFASVAALVQSRGLLLRDFEGKSVQLHQTAPWLRV